MSFWNDFESTINFDLIDGSATESRYPHSTGWRILPCAVFVCNTGGSYLLEIKDQDPLLSEDGESFLVPPGTNHRFTVGQYTEVVSTWIHFNFNMLTSIDLFNLIEFPTIYDKASSKAMMPSLDLLQESISRDLDFNQVVEKRLHAYQFVHQLLQFSKFKEQANELFKVSERMLPVLNYIQENLQENLSRKKLASLIFLSENRFNILFKSSFGMSPTEYIKRERLKRSQLLLIQTEKSVGEIGREVGINDPFYFSKTFKSHFKLSPLSYRKRNREYFNQSL